MSGAGDSLEQPWPRMLKLWPTPSAPEDEVAAERSAAEEKGFVARMTRVPDKAVQLALAGQGKRVSSLLSPVAWMFAIAALLIALDSAASVGVLVLLQRGIDSGVAAAICPRSAFAPCLRSVW
ncbi:Uncharacterised protein [Raoultella terrigena]|uniref:Uncharacterized protein n=1 Tax=Raoultella terrigena TaxID=577 RepID=A0A3P8KZD2_RAOTE|nr:Uncharacterised protein [Raoultella terrigena]